MTAKQPSLHGPIQEGQIRISKFGNKGKIEAIASNEVLSTYAGYVILAAKLNNQGKKSRELDIGFSAHLRRVSGFISKLW
jgi:hypothetical protein